MLTSRHQYIIFEMGAATGRLDLQQCPLVLDDMDHNCTEECRAYYLQNPPCSRLNNFDNNPPTRKSSLIRSTRKPYSTTPTETKKDRVRKLGLTLQKQDTALNGGTIQENRYITGKPARLLQLIESAENFYGGRLPTILYSPNQHEILPKATTFESFRVDDVIIDKSSGEAYIPYVPLMSLIAAAVEIQKRKIFFGDVNTSEMQNSDVNVADVAIVVDEQEGSSQKEEHTNKKQEMMNIENEAKLESSHQERCTTPQENLHDVSKNPEIDALDVADQRSDEEITLDPSGKIPSEMPTAGNYQVKEPCAGALDIFPIRSRRLLPPIRRLISEGSVPLTKDCFQSQKKEKNPRIKDALVVTGIHKYKAPLPLELKAKPTRLLPPINSPRRSPPCDLGYSSSDPYSPLRHDRSLHDLEATKFNFEKHQSAHQKGEIRGNVSDPGTCRPGSLDDARQLGRRRKKSLRSNKNTYKVQARLADIEVTQDADIDDSLDDARKLGRGRKKSLIRNNKNTNKVQAWLVDTEIARDANIEDSVKHIK